MSGFFSSLWTNLRTLPVNLVRGLRPGVDPDSQAPARRLRRSFFYHLHPLKVQERTLRPWVTLGLGLITATLFGILSVTGILLMIGYAPSAREAYASMQDLQFAVAAGGFLRALHRWAAHGMVVTVVLHLIRVASMGAFRQRELNWLLGLSLLLLTMGLAFTGYLLPWDQRSYWAVNVAAGMLDHVPLVGPPIKALLLGGDRVGQASLLRFYTLHVALLPGALLVVLAFHLWRIRKDGGLASRELAGVPPTVDAWPGLVLREALVVLWVVILLALLALCFNAPLDSPADPHLPSNPEKAPWYFLGIQEMVSYSATVGGFVFPGVFLLALLVWPFLDREDEGVGRWFGDRRARVGAGIAAAIAVAVLVLFEVLYTRGGSPGVAALAGTLAPDLFNPASGMLLVALGAFLGVGWATGSVRAGFLAGLVVMVVAGAGFTLLGVCRGPDWVLYWPWQEWPLVN